MTHMLMVLLLLAATSLAQNDAKSPSLSETLGWMKSTLGQKGMLDSDRNGYNRYEAIPGKSSYTEVIKSLSYEGCNIKIVKVAETDSPIISDFVAQYTDEFNLSDLDPNTIKTDTGDGDLRGHMVTFSTTNDKKLIRCSSITLSGKDAGKPSPCIPAMDDTEQLRFSSEEYTQRFAKALRHAITLCGGKRSTF